MTVTGVPPEASSSLGQAQVRELPRAFGDAFRAIEVLPGVVPIVSGLPYFYVTSTCAARHRATSGTSSTAYACPCSIISRREPAVLHPAFVGQVDLYSGAYPARYGRYAGGIVTGEMQEPAYELRGEASIRILDSGAMLEVPFDDGNASVMAGGRFSYTGLVISLLVPDLTLTYWDYQSRTRLALDEEDSLEVLVFGSGDFVTQDQVRRANDAATAHHGGGHRFSPSGHSLEASTTARVLAERIDARRGSYRAGRRRGRPHELLARCSQRRGAAFVSYTLSRSERFIARYAGPSTFDRAHVANVAASYDLGRSWRFGNRLMFYTGIPTVLGPFDAGSGRRTPPFWRLDWRLQKRWLYSYGYWGLILEVLNTTLNEEVVSLSCDGQTCDEDSIGPVTVPSIGAEGSF